MKAGAKKPEDDYGEHIILFESTLTAIQAFAVTALTNLKKISEAPMFPDAAGLPHAMFMSTIISEITKELVGTLEILLAQEDSKGKLAGLFDEDIEKVSQGEDFQEQLKLIEGFSWSVQRQGI